jgi:uncharacterized protein
MNDLYMKIPQPKSPLEAHRELKDQYFKTAPDSPLTPEQKKEFRGLHYFPENSDLRLEAPVDKFEKLDEIQMQTSTGDIQTCVRYGRIKFQVDGKEVELTIYRDSYGYFLPFVDALAGKETYGAGRYLEPEDHGDDSLLVDFNLAYNPYCAYNDLYSCPLTPFENRLKVPIRAGEKLFHPVESIS